MAERDEWGRIPAILIENDQEFCSLRWDELPCFAGPGSNLQAESRDFADDDIWQKTANALAFFGSRLSTPYYRIGYVEFFAASQSVTINPSYYSRLPVFDESKTLTFSFELIGIGSDDARVDACFISQGLPSTPSKYGFDFNENARTTSNISPEVSGITFEDVGSWVKVSFTIDTSDITLNSYSCFIEISQGAGVTETPRFAQFSIDETAVNAYKPTDPEIYIGGTVPCFNTVSTCQFLGTYLVENSRIGIDTVSSADPKFARWEGPFVGRRNEGLFVELYASRLSAQTPTGDPKIIDFGGILSLELRDNSVSEKFVWKYGSAEIVLNVVSDLTQSLYNSYKLAAYISPSGQLSVRYSDQVSQGLPLQDSTLDYVEIKKPDDSDMRLVFADILVYDYLKSRLNQFPSIIEMSQKGDRSGDALFHLPCTYFSGVSTANGVSPNPGNTLTEADLSLTAFPDAPLNLNPYFDVTLKERPLTLRYTKRDRSSRLPETLRAIPSMMNASNKPAQLQVGGTNENISSLGSRDELTVTFQDHPYSDYLVDPYRDQRTYDPITQGTYWGKWLARNVYKQGQAVRYVTGYELASGALERVHTYNYILDKVNGPTSDGKVTLKAFDILQSLRADRAVFPAANTGRLLADISDTATTATLDPVGIGDAEYPTGLFRIRIGGEGFDVTRSGDVLTFDGTGGTQRGLYGGEQSHTADDLVQVVARFEGEQVHDIAYDIITGALPELEGFIPKAKWDGLAADFLPRNYSADITEPTGVEDLLAELTATAPIYFYADVRTNLIELGVIREPSSAAVELTEGNQLIADTVDLKEYPKERIDEVWVYYRIRNPAEDIDDEENYSQRFILVNPQEQSFRGRRSIKRIYTRWIVAGARDTAEEIAQAYISRFQNAPIRVSFDLDAKVGDIWLGDVAKLVSRQKQTVTGESRDDLNYQVIQAHEPEPGHAFQYIAQSYEFFAPVDPDAITITIQPEDTVDGTGDIDQINLRELYNATVATEIDNITFVVAGGPLPSGGTVVGAGSVQSWSLNNPNDWPWAPAIELRIEAGGAVVGRGGDAGDGGDALDSGNTLTDGGDGGDGQTALLVGYATTINNLGIIGGGGGGGGGGPGTQDTPSQIQGGFAGSGGGGGAGLISGSGGSPGTGDVNNKDRFPAAAGQNGTVLNGGAGGGADNIFGINEDGGRGGDLGQAGSPGSSSPGEYDAQANPGAGGLPGLAIDGIANVTFITRGDIRGNEA